MPPRPITRFGSTSVPVAVLAAVTGMSQPALAAGWTVINTGLPGLSVGVNALAIDPSAPGTIYAQTTPSQGGMAASGLFKTTDGAANWRQLGNLGNVRCIVMDPSNSSTLYAGTDQGVARSTNGGETWTDASTNLPSGSILRIAIDPTTPGTLYAVSNAPSTAFGQNAPVTTLVKTTDSGATWHAIDTGLPQNAYVTVLTVAASNPAAVYIFAPMQFVPPGSGPQPPGGLLRSVDGGQTWKTLDLTSGNFVFINSLAIDPATPSTLYVSTNGGLLKSSDSGDTWTAPQTDLPRGISIASVITDPADSTAVYASGTIYSPMGARATLFRSRDGGSHWTGLDFGNSLLTIIFALAIDPASPDRIYVGGFSNANGAAVSGGVLKTSDAGVTWDSASSGLVNFDVRTAVLAADTGTIFAGGFGGTYSSADQGDTWNPTSLTAYTGSLVTGPGSVMYAMTGRASGCNSSESLLLKSSDGGPKSPQLRA